MSRWFEVGPCGVPLLRVLEDSRARDHLLEKIVAFASHGFPQGKVGLVLGGQRLAFCNVLVLHQHCIECLHIAAHISSRRRLDNC